MKNSTKNLQAFIDSENRMNALFDYKFCKPLSLATAKDRQSIANRLGIALEPENLCCDGELRGAKLRAKSKLLNAALDELVALDPSIEIYA
jgi:hypothetical protein